MCFSIDLLLLENSFFILLWEFYKNSFQIKLFLWGPFNLKKLKIFPEKLNFT